ncbi:MAG: 50S ribosomal protein L18 [Ignisphaera sp.]|uniref:Large ribosomal subunit protein uL18 n=1 Tax=Ignisphaera aggregans TaxID=334771 RepID=A0A7C4JJF8_9CREN
MAKNAKYRIPKRRRREGKTNYYKRYEMLKTNKIRAVVRKTNKYIMVQFVYATAVGDFTIVAAHSRELVKLFGWRGGTKNTPAAYLTGLLAGLRAKNIGILYAVPDIGLHRQTKGAKIFAIIKGIKDAGVEIPCSEEMFPSEDRIRGLVIAEYAKMLSESNIEKYTKQFSLIIKTGLDPRNLPQHFEEVYQKIINIYNSIPQSSEAIQLIESLTTVHH